MARRDEGSIKTVGWGPFALPGERKRLQEAEARRLSGISVQEQASPTEAVEIPAVSTDDHGEQDLLVDLGDDLNKGVTAIARYNTAVRSIVGGMAAALERLLNGRGTMSDARDDMRRLAEGAQVLHAKQVNSGQWPADKDDPLLSLLTNLFETLDRVDRQRPEGRQRGNIA